MIEMHSSWLAINSIVGCTNGCKYCFLQDKNGNTCEPKIIATPKEVIGKLLEFKFYDETLPLCLFPNTDIFLNETNINYLLKIFDLLEEKKINNDLVIVTKCLIPDYILNRLKQIQETGRNIVIYLSYSGLDKKFEPNVNHADIKQNFINLNKLGIPTVHYYRPFIKENSRKESIDKVLAFVHKYTSISATMGLMYTKTMLENDCFKKYLENVDIEELQNATSIWPEEAWEYFYNDYTNNQNFYQTNICALNSILGKPTLQYAGSYECKNFNKCNIEQRKICMQALLKRDTEEILIEKLYKLLEKLGYEFKKIDYIYDKNNGIEINNLSLDVKTLVYLSHILGIKIVCKNGKGINDKYNSTLNGSKPLILKK